MPAQPVLAGATYASGIVAAALGTYRRGYEVLIDRLGGIMSLDLPSDKRSETYAYYESAPYLVRWPQGTSMPDKPFKGVRYSCVNHRWARSVSWNYDDAQDDQTKSLEGRARDIGKNAYMLDERIYFQIRNGTTDVDLLPIVPNGPDGLTLHSASTRFGDSGGNISSESGADVDAGAKITKSYYDAMTRFRGWQDTEGQPLHDHSVIDGKKIVIARAGNEQAFKEAFVQRFVVGALGQPGAGAPSNLLQDDNQVPSLFLTSRIPSTDDDWDICLADAEIKPVFSQMREPLREEIATFQNSDLAREKGYESVRFWTRKGAAVNLPYATIQVVGVVA